MGRGLMAFVSAVLVVVVVSHLATLTTACTSGGGVDAGVCAPEAGVCFSNQDCVPTTCEAGDCPTHCTFGGFEPSGNTIFCCALGVPPGIGDGGAPCSGPDDCATGVCGYEADYQTTVCSSYCTADSDCPSVLPKCLQLEDAGEKKLCGLPPP